MNWQLILAVSTLVLSLATIFLVFGVWLQIRAARMERLESLWDVLFKSASEEAEGLEGKEKIKDITDTDKRIKFRRSRHLYLERIEEALRIEKPGKLEFWDKALKKRHKRVQEWYWKALNIYGDGDGIQVFNDVKLWHDYSKGELDPLEVGFRILNFLADKKEEERKIAQELVNKVFKDPEMSDENIRKEAERKLKDKLQDLKDLGFIKCKRKLTCKKYYELSKEGKEVMGRKNHSNI